MQNITSWTDAVDTWRNQLAKGSAGDRPDADTLDVERARLDALPWADLRSRAKELDVAVKGTRQEITDAILERTELG